jgi:regulator of extracellular matrix RemA (YlzA/DUF370 family)
MRKLGTRVEGNRICVASTTSQCLRRQPSEDRIRHLDAIYGEETRSTLAAIATQTISRSPTGT